MRLSLLLFIQILSNFWNEMYISLIWVLVSPLYESGDLNKSFNNMSRAISSSYCFEWSWTQRYGIEEVYQLVQFVHPLDRVVLFWNSEKHIQEKLLLFDYQFYLYSVLCNQFLLSNFVKQFQIEKPISTPTPMAGKPCNTNTVINFFINAWTSG